MAGYVDIHAHVLPGIDDGPEDMDESVAMARAAADSGIAVIASTPHLRPDFPHVHVHELAERCEATQAAINAVGVAIRLVSGAEVALTWALEASDEELTLASYGQRGTDLLIETPTGSAPRIDHLLYGLRARGYRITLAHPERGLAFQTDPHALRALVSQGVLLQVNADSLLGSGAQRGVKRLARDLLMDGLAHAIASDAHRGSTWRPITRLREAVEVTTKLVGRQRAEWMSSTAPEAIVQGAEPCEPPPVLLEASRRWHLPFGLGLR